MGKGHPPGRKVVGSWTEFSIQTRGVFVQSDQFRIEPGQCLLHSIYALLAHFEHFHSAFPPLGQRPGGGSSVVQSDIAVPCDCHIQYGALS